MDRALAGAGVAPLSTELAAAVANARDLLLGAQRSEGYWVGSLEADVSVGAGYLPLMYFLTGSLPPARAKKITTHIFHRQRPDGSWSAYQGGPGDLSVSTQTYFALKLAGVAAQSPELSAARKWIRRAGGLESVNTITRIWLALFGQVSWEKVPTLPPELILLPSWAPFSIYEFASWSRATIVALTALSALRPVCPVPETASLEDVSGCSERGLSGASGHWRALSWETFYLRLDRLLKRRERSRFKPLRRIALKRVEQWILSHQEKDGGWGGILLPWVYSLMALKSLGHSADGPVIAGSLNGLEDFFVEEEDGVWLQPATSPVWDTAWAVIALRESGLPPDHPALQQAARWLLEQEITREGDWKIKNRRLLPGCWAFEFVNQFYPDLDDTALVPRALLRVRLDGEEELSKQAAIRRAAAWIRGMQCRDGGWAAFDRDNNRPALSHVPYGDFMAPLDPPSADVTAHVLEFMTEWGARDRSFHAGQAYLRKTQEVDGAWYGRWGVNYLYGTGLAVTALAAAAQPTRGDAIEDALWRGVAWLVGCQNPDGGWGETCASYDHPSLRGKGVSTSSQTAWAVLGLTAAVEPAAKQPRAGLGAEVPLDGHAVRGEGYPGVREALQRGIEYLLQRQESDGAWTEREYTGTGFPRAFYLRYDLYRLYFPLLALGRYQSCLEVLSETERRFAATDPLERILLLSHCLRRSARCQAGSGSNGLECRHCSQECPVHTLTQAARAAGYRGVCVAPGGSMALRFVEATRPRSILAVACRKELEEGIQAVAERFQNREPIIVTVALSKEGCVDTEVDVERVLRIIALRGEL